MGDVAKENSMPPFRYWILHRESSLTNEERRIILEWVDKSQTFLKEKNK
ncbi:MAG: heme-binding domain-containing protein [Bdellovibrionales bacterium]|nr:heme-binding domain-containing protein [Bdellovibrionales bacterium]